MSAFPLRPAAGLLNIAAPEEVRGTVGDRLGGLAASLARFNAGLEGYADAFSPVFKKEGVEKARQLFTERQFQNIQELNDAVERGDLAFGDNPWTIRALRHMTARNQVRLALLEAEKRFQSGQDEDIVALRQAQSPSQLSSWLDKQVAESVRGMDAPTVASVVDVVDEFKDRFLSRTTYEWRKERESATVAGVERELQFSLLGRLSGDASWEKAQEIIHAATMTMPSEEAKTAVGRAVLSFALGTKDVSVLDDALANLKIGEKTLGEIIPPSDVAAIRERIEDSVWEDQNRARIESERQDVELERTVLSEMAAYWQGERDKGRVVTVPELEQFLTRLPLEAQYRVRRMMRELNAQDAQTYVVGSIEDPTSQQATELVNVLFMMGHGDAAKDILEWRRFKEAGQYASQDDPDGFAQAASVAFDSTMRPSERVSALRKLVQDHQITLPTYENMVSYVLKSALPGADMQNAAYLSNKQLFSTQLEEVVSTHPLMLESQLFGTGVPPVVQLAIQSELSALDMERLRLLESNPDMKPLDLANHLNQFMTRRLEGFRKQWSIENPNAVERVLQTNPTGAAVHGMVKWQGEQLIGPDGKPVSVALISDMNALTTQSPSVLRALGITDPESQLVFLAHQINQWRDKSERDAGLFWIKKTIWGSEVAEDAEDTKTALIREYRLTLDLQRKVREAMDLGRKRAYIYGHAMPGMERLKNWAQLPSPDEVEASAETLKRLEERAKKLDTHIRAVHILRKGPEDLKAAQKFLAGEFRSVETK